MFPTWIQSKEDVVSVVKLAYPRAPNPSLYGSLGKGRLLFLSIRMVRIYLSLKYDGKMLKN